MNLRDMSPDQLTQLYNAVQAEVDRRAQADAIGNAMASYVANHGTADLAPIVSSLGLCGLAPAPEPEPTPEPEPEPSVGFAFIAHMPEGRGEYWGAGLDTRLWADGSFVYYPGPWGHSELKWDQYWADVVARFPNGLHTVVSPKTLDEAALTDFCERLPQAWRSKMVYAFYQEPEDNFTTEAQIASFRANVKRAGEIVRPYGIRNAVELQEWSLNPSNSAYPSGMDNTARFVDPADIDHISWSLYEKNLKNRSAEMVGRVKAFMDRFPTLTWDMSATGVAVPVGTPQGDAKRTTRANIVKDFLALAKGDPRCTGFGWFDFPAWSGTLDYAVDPELRAVFQDFLDNLNA